MRSIGAGVLGHGKVGREASSFHLCDLGALHPFPPAPSSHTDTHNLTQHSTGKTGFEWWSNISRTRIPTQACVTSKPLSLPPATRLPFRERFQVAVPSAVSLEVPVAHSIKAHALPPSLPN